MAIYTGTTSDRTINSYLSSIRTAEYGIEARAPMAASIQRCYELAKIKAGATNIPQSAITSETNHVKKDTHGDDVRTGFVHGINLCYQARGIGLSSVISGYLDGIIYAQTGEDLKNNILKAIVKCYQDVS